MVNAPMKLDLLPWKYECPIKNAWLAFDDFSRNIFLNVLLELVLYSF